MRFRILFFFLENGFSILYTHAQTHTIFILQFSARLFCYAEPTTKRNYRKHSSNKSLEMGKTIVKWTRYDFSFKK